ncbi:MAG: DUF4388 domain-containing protein [Desulfofustis sp.]|jgi:CheY-like chemotaxis protein|nr:DUF4388 domain-containing protein [Desulfofustis sp.]
MNTILIIEPVVAELEAVMNFCRRGSDSLTVLPARDLQKSHGLLRERQIDLILCSTAFTDEAPCSSLAEIAKTYPYIPVIGISDDPSRDQDLALSAGACACFGKPLAQEDLLQQIVALAEASSTGTVQGVPLHSLLQMYENDGQTCTLHVFSSDGDGYIFIDNGTVINAECNGVKGEAAFYEMISWEEVIIDIRYFNGLRRHEISTPLISLIMEGFRRKDERSGGALHRSGAPRTRRKLQQVSNAGMRLALNIGQPLSLEFDACSDRLVSMLAGMIPEQCLIVVTPSQFIVTGTPIETGTVVVVRFTHLEQLFLFRTKITRVLHTPQHLLFLDYPTIIHYHDVRKAARTAASFPCLLKTRDHDVFNAVFKDISNTGALLKVPADSNGRLPDIDIKQHVKLSCSLPEIGEQIELSGVVQNFKKDLRGVQIGVEFTRRYSVLDQSIDRYLRSVRLG